MKCPECGRQAADEARFCSECGSRIDRTSVSAEESRKSSVRGRPRATLRASHFFAALGALAALVGSSLPWYEVGGYVARGFDFTEGRIAIGFALVGGGLALYGFASGKVWLRWILLVSSLGVLGFSGILAIDIWDEARLWGGTPMDFFGVGLLVSLGGGLLMLIAELSKVRRR